MNKRHFFYALLCILCIGCINFFALQTPFNVATGIAQGVASLPYFASADTGIEDINTALIQSNKEVTLEDTYVMAYGKSLAEAGLTGDTGQIFVAMKDATGFFQKILQGHGVPNADKYIIASVDTANEDGYILFAFVYRPYTTITIVDKYDKTTRRTLTREDRSFYDPYRMDADGRSLDTIVDWAGLPIRSYDKQKNQAIMLTLAANRVLEKATRDDYWIAEQRWIEGQFGAVCSEQDQRTCSILGIKKGFMKEY